MAVPWHRNRASMLVVVMMITFVLLMLVMVVGSNTIENMRATSAVTDKREARYAAYAGLQRAVVELQKSPDWTTGFSDVPMPSKTSLCYSVEVRNNLKGTLNQSGVPVEKQVPPESVMLDAVAGDRLDPSKPMRAVTALSGLAVPQNAVFQQAAFTDSSTIMDGGSVTEAFDFGAWIGDDRINDVHDSLKGLLTSTSSAGCPERGKAVANRQMKLSGGSKIDGDVTLPKQSKDGTGLTANIDYTGKETIMKKPQPMPGFVAPYDPEMATESRTDFPSTIVDDGKGKGKGKDKDEDEGGGVETFQTLAPGAYKDVSVPTGQKVILTSGTYYFKDNFQIDGEVLLEASGGPVMVYVGCNMTVNGGLLNEGGKPRDLQVYFCDELKNLDYDGNPNPQPTPPPQTGASPSDNFQMETEVKEFISNFTMNTGSRATMVTAGKHTIAKLSGARLLGAIVVDYMDMANTSKIQYDKDLRSQNFYANCQWNLQAIHERSVGR